MKKTWGTALRVLSITALFVALTAAAQAQQVTVDIAPGRAVNAFSPLRALGAAVDEDPPNSVQFLYDPTNVQRMLTAGWGPISYRNGTELDIQAWHWNPAGTWSAPSSSGYFVGSPNSAGVIGRSFGYLLPDRGTTSNYGTSNGYSRLDDGDPATYWKSDPYLDKAYTGVSNTLHPGWIVVDLGKRMPVNAIRIAWTNPYATTYQVQYWTGSDAIGSQAGGNWVTFPTGSVTGGRGGTVTLTLSSPSTTARFVRVLMTASSDTCDSHGSADRRNCVGFAIDEVYLGTVTTSGVFTDLMKHRADAKQTATYASSVDSWHEQKDVFPDNGEQPGFDRIFRSGLTRGIPMTVPVAVLYDNPQNAANEIAYIESRGYAIRYVELGEEPDGQFVLPEDYAALFIEWADAIHRVDPRIQLAGPIFEGVNSDIQVWRNAQGNVSWFNRFLRYLQSRGRLRDLNVMTFEHYPYNPCHTTWNDLYNEPRLVQNIMQVWRNDGLPPNVPMQITESNLAYDTSIQYMEPFGALWLADYAGAFLTAGGQALYYYQWEPIPMYRGCGGWGTFGMFEVGSNYTIEQPTSQYFAAQLLTQQWADPVDRTHVLFPASTDIKDSSGHVLVTSYAVFRPDGRWALLLVNKDRTLAHSVTVDFHDAANRRDYYFAGGVTDISFGPQNYAWHAAGQNGFANPDGPATTSIQRGGRGAYYTLPAASITVLRGTIARGAFR